MLPHEVEQLVDQEIAGQWDRPTSHGLELRKSVLRPPVRETFVWHSGDSEHALELWRVIEERRGGKLGYLVIFDEEDGSFGLGVIDQQGRSVYLGTYGTLWDALEGM